jgi:catechol 2,3-dioxygenase
MTIAHLGHAELRVTDLAASRSFFTDVLGLSVSAESDTQVYLRAWQDWDHHTLLLTQAEESGLEHVGWRVSAAGDLHDHELSLKAAGVDVQWLEGGSELGHGDSLRFRSPVSGVPMELYWEVERYVERDPALESRLPSHPQRYTGHGVGPRRFDHVNFLVNNVQPEQEWMATELGFRHNYYMVAADGSRLASWMARTNLSHELAFMRNRNQNADMLHHVAYYLDSPDQVMRAATIIADAGYTIEWGPAQHGTSGAIFLYCFEPSGHRIEVWTGGFLLFAPDWEPIRWEFDQVGTALDLWGSTMPDAYLTRGTPLTPVRTRHATV